MPPSAAPEWLRTGCSLRDDGDVDAASGCLDCGAHAGQAGSDDDDVMACDHAGSSLGSTRSRACARAHALHPLEPSTTKSRKAALKLWGAHSVGWPDQSWKEVRRAHRFDHRAERRTDRHADPIEWVFWELRGPGTAHGSYEQTTLEFWPSGEGQEATLTDGRMTYAHDPGNVERWYHTIPGLLRDEADPDAAFRDARRGGAAALATVFERRLADGSLDRYRIASGSRPDRDPDQVDLWIRRESGARERVIVPVDGSGGPLGDAIAAASTFAASIRS